MPNYTIFSRVLDSEGDGTGQKNARGNYAGSNASMMLKPASGTVFHLTRMLVYIRDTGSFDAEDYGNGITLTAGIEVFIKDANGTIVNLTDSVPIMNNGSWSRICYDVNQESYGTGDEYLAARWTFAKAGQEISLDGSKGEYLEVQLRDNLSNLVEHRFTVQGYNYR
jgi:hypothetical protein